MQSQCVRRPEGPQDWEAQRAAITHLYITKGLELEVLMKTMEEEHFFKATKKQYKKYFTKWDLRKNIKPSEYNAIIKKKRKREDEGKDSVFRLRGAVVNDSKIVRYEKKRTAGEEHEIAEAETPDDLSCFTPSPIRSSPSAPSPVLPEFPRIFDMGSLPDCITRLRHIHTPEEMKDYPNDIRVRYITTSRDVRGGAERFEISITASARGKVIDLPGLAIKDQKRMHTPVRRSKSCESVRSLSSFLSDPVVDWKELLCGYNR